MKRKEFDPIPNFPKVLIEPINNSSLILFLGAGVSRTYGFPSWKKLANQMFEYCYKRHYINDKTYHDLLNANYPEVRAVSTASKIIDDNQKRKNAGVKVIKKLLSCKYNKTKCKTIAKYLSYFNCPIITTNADISLDKTSYYKNNVYDYLSEDACDIVSRGIVHLHGSVNVEDKMIFTADQYLKAYYFDKKFKDLISKLLNQRNKKYYILFIGYSLNEFEVVSSLLPDKSIKKFNLFMMEGYYSHQYEKYIIDQAYYESLHIKIIPYSLDEYGYESLYKVLESWSGDLNKYTTASFNNAKLLKELANHNPNNSRSVLNSAKSIIDSSNINEYKVVEIIINSKYSKEWITALLNNKRLFDVKKHVIPKIKLKEGRYQFTEWEGLNLLLQLDNNDKLINNKIASLVRKSIAIIENDKAKNDIDKISSNVSVVESLIKIALKNKNVCKKLECEIEKLFILYANNSLNYVFVLLDIIEKNKDTFDDINPKIVTNILMNLLKKDKYLDDNKLKTVYFHNLIKSNYMEYFNECVLFLSNLDEYHIRNFGSLLTYKDDGLDNHYSVYIDWMVNSIKCMSENELEQIYKRCEKSKNLFMKKVLVVIVSLHYSQFSKRFWSNKKIYDRVIYLDIKTLIDNNNIDKDEIKIKSFIKKNIKYKDSKICNELRNYLLSKYNPQKYPCDLTDKDNRIFLENYGKMSYFVDRSGDDNKYYDLMKSLNLKEVQDLKTQLKGGSGFFSEILWNEAFIKYISNNNFSIFINDFNVFFNEPYLFVIEAIRHCFLESKEISAGLKKKFINHDLNAINKYDIVHVKYMINYYAFTDVNNLIDKNDIHNFIDFDANKLIDCEINYLEIINSEIGSYYRLLLKFVILFPDYINIIKNKLCNDISINYKPLLAIYRNNSTLMFDFNNKQFIEYLFENNKNIKETLSFLFYRIIDISDIETIISSDYYKKNISQVDYKYVEAFLNNLLYCYFKKGRYLNEIINIFKMHNHSCLESIVSYVSSNGDDIKEVNSLFCQIEQLKFKKIKNMDFKSLSIIKKLLELYKKYDDDVILKIVTKYINSCSSLYGRKDLFETIEKTYRDIDEYNNMLIKLINKLNNSSFYSHDDEITLLFLKISKKTKNNKFFNLLNVALAKHDIFLS